MVPDTGNTRFRRKIAHMPYDMCKNSEAEQDRGSLENTLISADSHTSGGTSVPFLRNLCTKLGTGGFLWQRTSRRVLVPGTFTLLAVHTGSSFTETSLRTASELLHKCSAFHRMVLNRLRHAWLARRAQDPTNSTSSCPWGKKTHT